MALLWRNSDSSADVEPSVPATATPPARGRSPSAQTPTQAPGKAPPKQARPAAQPAANSWSWRSIFHTSAGAMTSMFIHLIAVVAMAMVVIEQQLEREETVIVAETVKLEDRPEELHKVELENQMELVKEQNAVRLSSSSVLGDQATSGPAGMIATTVSEPHVEESLLEQMVAPEIKITGIVSDLPSVKQIIQATPDGQIGEARMIVDNYQQALDQISQELLWMMDKGPVLTLWCFDQSESMKDDQKEIRDRIEHVYAQLGLVSKDLESRMTTAVTSYGKGFGVHTPKPTSNRDEIRTAISNVPVDPSGEEMMCQAVVSTLSLFRPYAQKSRRQMALILVTDESGDRNDNDRFLEQAIAEARASQCRTYILGREAVFGYPFAHIRWIHPQTKRHHWLAIDRGPETAFVETLQTDGFHRRTDAHPSGFGPYEQTRMARETGGIFFLLPSIESDLVHGEKRRYALEAMGPYLPDLRGRYELGVERDQSPLRSSLTKVIYDLNPYNPVAAKIIEMRTSFSPGLIALGRQVREEQQKAIIYLKYLAAAQEHVDELYALREREANPRWQANYDLLAAQIVAYQARIYEYGVYLDQFVERPKIVPPTKSPNLTHTHWSLGLRKELVAGEKSKPYADRAQAMFEALVKTHPGTPWAARAEIELRRGFGVHLVEVYEPPAVVVPPGVPLMPVPKL